MVGCVGIVKRGESRAQLRWLLLEKKYRGRGIGKKLAENAVEYCRKELGVKVVFLSTIKGLAVSRLYELLGFKVVSEKEVEVWGEKRIEQVYELALS
jgi:ribosomal protein S18 acetylase RimI-like enzyme